jgi:hypothetical protein
MTAKVLAGEYSKIQDIALNIFIFRAIYIHTYCTRIYLEREIYKKFDFYNNVCQLMPKHLRYRLSMLGIYVFT